MPDDALKRLAAMSKPGSWLIAALEGVQAHTGEGRQDPGWFHPSSLGSECDAYLAFVYLGAPQLVSIRAQTQRIFDNGSGRDLWLKNDAIHAGISLTEEFPEPRICPDCHGVMNDTRHICIPRLHIRGELDEHVQNPVTRRKYVVDFKTMRSDLYKELEMVKHDHHVQVHPYMFKKETYEGYVLYENKDSQEQKCMAANFDNQIWQAEICDRIERVLDSLDHGYVMRNPVRCNQCPFFANGVCTKNQIAQLKEASGLYAQTGS